MLQILFHINYDDGDEEDLYVEEIRGLVVEVRSHGCQYLWGGRVAVLSCGFGDPSPVVFSPPSIS